MSICAPSAALAGLRRTALSLARVPPGRESFIYHSHEHDEEFLFILSGRGRAEIDGEIIEVGPGDFMGFPTPSVAHHLTNPYERIWSISWAASTAASTSAISRAPASA